MTTAEEKLAAFLGEDAPPARDAAFRIAVLEGIERRRARNQLLLVLAVTLLALVVLGALAPIITPWLVGSGATIAALFAGAALSWASIVLVRQGTAA